MRRWPYTKNAPMAQKFCDQGRKTTFATLSAIVAGQTCRPEGAGVMAVNVRFGSKADISACRCNVRFTPIAIGALDACNARGYATGVVVLDRGGNVMISLRADNAGLHTVENARRKAYTSLTFKITTSTFIE